MTVIICQTHAGLHYLGPGCAQPAEVIGLGSRPI